MANPPLFPGVVDYSADPLLPPWYIPGWTNQNEANVLAPTAPFVLSTLPTTLTYIEVTGTWSDAAGNPQGGYLTFELSNNLLVTVTGSPNQYFTIPASLTGNLASGTSVTAGNQQGSGKIHLIYGNLDVSLLATDNSQVTPVATPVDQYAITGELPITPVGWVYHVKEYWLGGRKYDITVPSATTPVDINNLIVPGTTYLNVEWDRGI